MNEMVWIALIEDEGRERIVAVADSYEVVSKIVERYLSLTVGRDNEVFITFLNHMVCTEDTWEDFLSTR